MQKVSPEGNVIISPKQMKTHTVIVGQSGSGKSFLLGRLIEEILTQTKASCLIFDPNSDFKNFDQLRESTEEDVSFKKNWEIVGKSMSILTGDKYTSPPRARLRIWWPSISIDIFSSALDPIGRMRFRYCHEFTKAVANMMDFRRKLGTGAPSDLLQKADQVYTKMDRTRINSSPADSMREIVRNDEFKDIAERRVSQLISGDEIVDVGVIRRPPKNSIAIVDQFYSDMENRMIAGARYSNKEAWDYYLAQARLFDSADILAKVEPLEPLPRVQVIDLPSLKENTTKILAVNDALGRLWSEAQSSLSETPGSGKSYFVPTFIVLDEAHNLIPNNPTSESQSVIREQFRTIAAEGRKYGLFLILVTQRVDKLDPLVISECENRAVMHLNSKVVTEKASELLGADDEIDGMLSRTTDFRSGMSLLFGPWTDGNALIMSSGGRRTKEGARRLDDDYWGSPVKEMTDGN